MYCTEQALRNISEGSKINQVIFDKLSIILCKLPVFSYAVLQNFFPLIFTLSILSLIKNLPTVCFNIF